MKFQGKNIILYLFLFIGSFLFAQTEFKIPEKPSKIYPVNDFAKIFTPEQTERLNQKLISYSDSTSTEIIVCTVSTLDGDEINYVGAKWGEKWGIGQKGENNGILLLIAVNDRKLTIQTGRGTEDAMTDRNSSIIINEYMVPYLKQNDFYGAVNSGTDQILKVLQGKFNAKPKSDNPDDVSGFVVALVIFGFILFFVLMSKKSESNTYYDRKGKRRKDDDDFWGGFLGGGGFGGFGGGSGSSGGGFGGFGGGGSFGGGGASGSW